MLNTYPDREGIETPTNVRECPVRGLNTYPDREGIETPSQRRLRKRWQVEYLPRPRGD